MRCSGDAQFGNPNGQIGLSMNCFHKFLEASEILPGSIPVCLVREYAILTVGASDVPMHARHVCVASLFLDCAEKGFHPFEVPNDSGSAEFDALFGPRIDLLHIEVRSGVGIHVGLARDVWLVK